ncbi:MAG: hypothetical protein NT080_10190 [Spirochaetes bacterium]|nr:hypothetical protein [Spirochaetota bacterium]
MREAGIDDDDAHACAVFLAELFVFYMADRADANLDGTIRDYAAGRFESVGPAGIVA